MKLDYENPMIDVIGFDNENIVTVSGVTQASDELESKGADDVQVMNLAEEGVAAPPNLVW